MPDCMSRADCKDVRVQAAVVSNTHALVQRNIAAGIPPVSRQSIPGAEAFSPCGQLMAWFEAEMLFVEDRLSRQPRTAYTLPTLAYNCKVTWNYDGARLALTCATGVYTLALVTGEWQQIVSSISPFNDVHIRSSWAPSAQSLALVQRQGSGTLLSLCQASGTEPLNVNELELPQFHSVAWAADSRALAASSRDGLIILNTATHGLRRAAVPGNAAGVVAWSPGSWAIPHLLCIVCRGEAILVDHEAALKGRVGDPVQGEAVFDTIWGESGVLVLTCDSLWLFDVRITARGLALDCKLHRMTSVVLRMPMLSPDQVHVCMLQPLGPQTKGRDLLCNVVILNLVSGHLTLFKTQDRLPAVPRCSWTSTGFSLIVTLTTLGINMFSYKMFRFVC